MGSRTGSIAHNRANLIGQRFGKLSVVSFKESRGQKAYWECKCDCGNICEANTADLTTGKKKSCGCLRHRGLNRLIDISGERFGKLTVIERAGKTDYGKILWKCQCDCGNITYATKEHLGRCTNSCGCLKAEKSRERFLRHGETKTRLHDLWCSMRLRCRPNGPESYVYYERGIRVCEEWDNNYEAFRDWALSHGYDPTAPRGVTTIDRIDNDKGYSPDNCRFVTQTENARNKRNNHIIVVDGEHLCLNEAAQKYGINNGTLAGRIARGWNPEDAVKMPVRKGRYRNGRQK